MTTAPDTRSDAAELQALAALLPAPAVHDLSDARHDALRALVLSELDRHDRAAEPGPGATALRRRRRRPALTIAAGAVAAAFAAVLAVALLSGDRSAQPPHATLVEVAPPSTRRPAAVLEDVATVAARMPALAPDPEQYAYVESIGAFTHPARERTTDGPRVLGPITRREVWMAQRPVAIDADPAQGGAILDGRPLQQYDLGLIRSDGRATRIIGTEPPAATYAQLAALPTDPAALLAKIRATVAQPGAPATPQAQFDHVGELLKESLAPPRVTAALYRAAALIPGVTVVEDSVDAAGRHGFAVAHVAGGERSEWIFDRATKQYLGERDVLVADTPGGRAGMLTGTTAVLRRGVADGPSEPPLRTDPAVKAERPA